MEPRLRIVNILEVLLVGCHACSLRSLLLLQARYLPLDHLGLLPLFPVSLCLAMRVVALLRLHLLLPRDAEHLLFQLLLLLLELPLAGESLLATSSSHLGVPDLLLLLFDFGLESLPLGILCLGVRLAHPDDLLLFQLLQLLNLLELLVIEYQLPLPLFLLSDCLHLLVVALDRGLRRRRFLHSDRLNPLDPSLLLQLLGDPLLIALSVNHHDAALLHRGILGRGVVVLAEGRLLVWIVHR